MRRLLDKMEDFALRCYAPYMRYLDVPWEIKEDWGPAVLDALGVVQQRLGDEAFKEVSLLQVKDEGNRLCLYWNAAVPMELDEEIDHYMNEILSAA